MKLRRRRDEDDDLWADDPLWSDDGWDEDDSGRRPRRWLWLLLLALVVALGVGGLLWGRLDNRVSLAPTPRPVASLVATPPPTPLLSGVTRIASDATPAAAPFDPAALTALMLDLINADRAAANLSPVAWDETAAAAGLAHAADMVARDYFSHWNPDGLGPDHRYSAAGGRHTSMENLHAFSYTFEDGRAAPIDDWAAIIRNAQTGLMQSPGHRANILDPAHTHVGIGMAYNPTTGQFRLAQEFTNQYAVLDPPLPAEARAGDTLHVAGTFSAAARGNAILDLAYEPFPAPLSAAELAARSTYSSPAESIDTRGVGLTFDETLVLPDAPGFYHVRLFVDLASGQALVVDQVVAVR